MLRMNKLNQFCLIVIIILFFTYILLKYIYYPFRKNLILFIDRFIHRFFLSIVDRMLLLENLSSYEKYHVDDLIFVQTTSKNMFA